MQSPSGHNIGPRTGVLRAYYEANLEWRIALGELIDNAFDAGATNVSIAFRREKGGAFVFVIRDDGSGCESDAALLSLVTIGEHRPRGQTRLGRYGIGGKEAMLWIGRNDSKLLIESIHGKVRRSLRLDWDRLEASNSWNLAADDLSIAPADAEDRGTMIRITSKNLRQPPHGAAFARLATDLGYIYAPAIKDGRQITLRTDASKDAVVVQRYDVPAVEPGHVDTMIDVGGKRARVYVCVVPPGVPNPRYGITYTHGFRVILEASDRGCGGFATSRIFGVVNLLDGWVLNKNKDGISRNQAELFDAVFECCRELLKRAASSAQQLESAALENLASKLLNEYLGTGPADTKARRGKGETHGTKGSTGRGGKHSRAERVQAGATFGGGRNGRIEIQFDVGDPAKYGTFNGGRTIVLHTNHPTVAAVQRDKDARGTVLLAMPLVALGALVGEQKQLWERAGVTGGGTRDVFERAMGALLLGPRLDGQDATDAPSAERASTPQRNESEQ